MIRIHPQPEPQPRQPKGLPVGGQWASTDRPESGASAFPDASPPEQAAPPERRSVGVCQRCIRPVVLTGIHRRAICPGCGAGVRVGVVVGHYSPEVNCDDRCLFAWRPKCECSCGGANHSRGYLVTELTPDGLARFRDEWRRRSEAAKAAAATRAQVKAQRIALAAAQWRAEHPLEAAWLAHAAAANSFAADLDKWLQSHGSLTPAQERWASHLAEQHAAQAQEKAEEPKTPQPAPVGTTVVSGTILSVQRRPSRFHAGSDLKMLVQSDQGWRVWVTKPTFLYGVHPGEKVRFVADLTPAQGDETFAFGSRPRKAPDEQEKGA